MADAFANVARHDTDSSSSTAAQEGDADANRDTDPDPDDTSSDPSSFPSSSFTSLDSATTATSPESSLPTDTPTATGTLDGQLLSLRPKGHHEPMEDALVPRVVGGPMTRKKMDEEAIAGTAVGVVLGVALLACCLYPVIVHRLKKNKRHNRFSFDCEGNRFRGQPAVSTRRLSSSDSYKRNQSPRNNSAGKGRDGDRGSHNANGQAHYVNASLDTNIPIEPAPTGQNFNPYYTEAFPAYYMPEALPDGTIPAQPYVLKGTSEDYYSPFVPSEAFGMYPTPEPPPEIRQPERAMSRGNSLRYNVRQIFRRKSTQNSESSASHSYDQSDLPPHLQNATPMQNFFPHQDIAESPVELNEAPQFPNSGRGLGSQDAAGESSRGMDIGESTQSPYSERYFGHSSQPAPATVNPMDIMPASTESEVWHRTDYQLYSNSGDFKAQNMHHIEQAQTQQVPIIAMPQPPQHHQMPQPPSQPEQMSTSAPPPVPQPLPVPKKQTSVDSQPAAYSEPTTQASMGMVPLPTRLPNVGHSELSTPAQGTASTTTQSTPSTHVDSPSPESLNSSDYCQSTSPHALGLVSPKGGVYSCDEPGCNQVFDQPHKLKHHQRYHSKDHKCPYPACGKGFGTKTHLQRHINDRHEKKKKFHCSIQGCDYSRAGGKAFPRKDNWKRHMTKIHGMDQKRLPEPVEVDQEMTGT